MTDRFDPYHVWLGIPPEEQPPNHYRLLGIKPLEDSPEVIENAADRQTVHLRTFQLSKYRDLAEELLNEVATARICLLNQTRKAAYDQQLRKVLDAPGLGSAPPPPVPPRAKAKIQGAVWLAVGLGAVAVLSVLGGVLWWSRTGGNQPASPAGQVASATPNKVPPKPSQPESVQVQPALPPGPPLARAPFDAEQAKQHQQRWAEHLGEPVEMTNSIGMKFVLIPAGEFAMGSTPEEIAAETEWGKKKESQGYLDQVPAEGPRHPVKITKPFYLGMYQVTQGEYEKVMGVNPSAFTEKQMEMSVLKIPLRGFEAKTRPNSAKKVLGEDTSRHPVETVSWEGAMEFCQRLSSMPAERTARRVYRLPTEAESEYACRAGTTTRWYSGDDEAGLVDWAWFNKNAGGMTHPVGQKKPNAWGLYDMHGNVWHWCSDWYSADYYQQSPPIDPAGPPAGSARVLRGGNWHCPSSYCRSASRYSREPAARSRWFGFRVVAGR
jgi:formylglycine-generating enzyme required for sulfatase activity